MTRIQRNESQKYQQNGVIQARHGRWWMVVMWLLIIAGVLLILYEPIKLMVLRSYSPTITRQSISRQKPNDADYNFNHAKPISMRQVLQARLTGRIRTAGEMLVPGEVHLPIGLGVSNTTLALAAGTMRANDQMGHGNYALAGHHMINRQALFTPLYYHAHSGTRVYVTNLRKVYCYQIDRRQMISPYDVGVANNTVKPRLTLITCNDSGSRRLLLQGHLIGSKRLDQAPKAIKSGFKQRMNNYNVFKGY